MTFLLILTVKKKCSAGLKLSNLMNLGRKKSTSLEPPDRSLETSSKTSSPLPDQRAGCPPGARLVSGRQLRQRRQGCGVLLYPLPGGRAHGSQFLSIFAAGSSL